MPRVPARQAIMASTAIPAAPLPLEAIAADPLMRDRETAPILGISIPSLWRGAREGTLPRPIKVGRGCSRWLLSEILAFIEAAKADRDAA